MLKSFEYIHPILAQKIHKLDSQLKKVQESRNEIINNSKLTQATREKLLKYQTECSNNIEKMLNEQKDKLTEYLDQQTNVITKTSRLSASRTGKANVTLNQSTRLQFQGTDDSNSLDATKTDINRKISSFYVVSTQRQQKPQNSKFPTKNLLKVRQLKKKVSNQQKLIKILISWIKIYYQRQQNYRQTFDSDMHSQNYNLKRENLQLISRCRSLEEQIIEIRQQVKNKTLSILQTHKKYDQIKNENSGLKLQRKQLLNTARSLKKSMQY